MEQSEEFQLSILQKLIINILKCGPLPEHMAIILDGNRRYARKRGIRTQMGHKIGFDLIDKIKHATFYIGIKHLTLYMLSIDNFKRQHDEVQYLMDLIRYEFIKYLVSEPNYNLLVHGEIDMLPVDIQVIRIFEILYDSKKSI